MVQDYKSPVRVYKSPFELIMAVSNVCVEVCMPVVDCVSVETFNRQVVLQLSGSY